VQNTWRAIGIIKCLAAQRARNVLVFFMDDGQVAKLALERVGIRGHDNVPLLFGCAAGASAPLSRFPFKVPVSMSAAGCIPTTSS
jgi:hypothetical protein